MSNELTASHVFVCGDTHTLNFLSIIEHYNLKNFILIHVGDIGTGFDSRQLDDYTLDELNEYCRINNGRILAIRGNHDDPAAFTSNSRYNREFIEFIPDYTYRTINGKVFLFVGGATSIDRTQRIVGKSYWIDEKFVLPDTYESLAPCDVLVTHSAPLDVYPSDGLSRIAGWFKLDPTLKEELIEERTLIRKLYETVHPSINLYGHFHASVSERIDGTWFRCLDINEILDITHDL